MVTRTSLPSEGPLVGHPVGHPDSVCTDGLHRTPVRPHYGTLGPGLTLEQICLGEFVQHRSDREDWQTAGSK